MSYLTKLVQNYSISKNFQMISSIFTFPIDKTVWGNHILHPPSSTIFNLHLKLCKLEISIQKYHMAIFTLSRGLSLKIDEKQYMI